MGSISGGRCPQSKSRNKILGVVSCSYHLKETAQLWACVLHLLCIYLIYYRLSNLSGPPTLFFSLSFSPFNERTQWEWNEYLDAGWEFGTNSSTCIVTLPHVKEKWISFVWMARKVIRKRKGNVFIYHFLPFSSFQENILLIVSIIFINTQILLIPSENFKNLNSALSQKNPSVCSQGL